jgi:hypothetical protein
MKEVKFEVDKNAKIVCSKCNKPLVKDGRDIPCDCKAKFRFQFINRKHPRIIGFIIGFNTIWFDFRIVKVKL